MNLIFTAKAFMKTIGEFSQIQGDADRLTKLLVTFFKHNRSHNASKKFILFNIEVVTFI